MACTRRTWDAWCSGEDAPLPCTPRGIVELLRRYDVPINGAEVVVVGRGVTVGRPIGLLLTRRKRERHGHVVPHRHQRLGWPPRARRHHRRRCRGPCADYRGRHQARRSGARRRNHANRARAGGRCSPRGGRGCWIPGADAWGSGPDDAGDAGWPTWWSEPRRSPRSLSHAGAQRDDPEDHDDGHPKYGSTARATRSMTSRLVQRAVDQWPLALVLLAWRSGWWC